MTSAPPPLWICPRCGHQFVTRNLWHSCTHYTLDHHFADKEPRIRRLFNRFLRVIRANGPVTVIPQKTRIALMTRVRFAAVMPKRGWLDLHLWLTRRAAHPRLRRIDDFGPTALIHNFRFSTLDEFDAPFAALVREAYAVGRQDHLPQPRRRQP
jgi:hypothetical protein